MKMDLVKDLRFLSFWRKEEWNERKKERRKKRERISERESEREERKKQTKLVVIKWGPIKSGYARQSRWIAAIVEKIKYKVVKNAKLKQKKNKKVGEERRLIIQSTSGRARGSEIIPRIWLNWFRQPSQNIR